MVEINYMASECLLKGDFEYNPMPNLQYTKAACDFKKMLDISPHYKSHSLFAEHVDFVEPPHQQVREEIFKAYPESIIDISDRSISLIEDILNRIKYESK